MQAYTYINSHPIQPTWHDRLVAFDRRHTKVIDAIGTAGCFGIIGACLAVVGIAAIMGAM